MLLTGTWTRLGTRLDTRLEADPLPVLPTGIHESFSVCNLHCLDRSRSWCRYTACQPIMQRVVAAVSLDLVHSSQINQHAKYARSSQGFCSDHQCGRRLTTAAAHDGLQCSRTPSHINVQVERRASNSKNSQKAIMCTQLQQPNLRFMCNIPQYRGKIQRHCKGVCFPCPVYRLVSGQ